MKDLKQYIEAGEGILGIEFGSTRIKAVLIGDDMAPIAQGDYTWENQLADGIWTYPMDQVILGLQTAFGALQKDVEDKFGTRIRALKALGISAMMHGYIALDQKGELLVPFRTWRNTITGEAAKELSEAFSFNIPERWTSAHLRQAILKKEAHVPSIYRVTTLAGYVTWRLSGAWAVGVGEASGIFPIDPTTRDYDEVMVQKYDVLNRASGFTKKLRDVFPKCMSAGEVCGTLTKEGAALLDPTGLLQPGAVMAPPEGDAGTGMAATNSVRVRTGNVSAGTSVFSMIVLEKPMQHYYSAIDVVTTPDGAPVAMVHCNNCTSDLNAWVKLMKESMEALGQKVDTGTLYTRLFEKALEGDQDCSGLCHVNYVSGESITGFTEGRPLFVRQPASSMTLANFMRSLLYSCLATLKIGNDILFDKEQVKVDTIYGQGGYFKTPVVGQQMLADALNAPISVMATAGEGGPWGMALLAAYVVLKDPKETLADFLDRKVFRGEKGSRVSPDPEGVEGFNRYLVNYQKSLRVERIAVDCL